MAQDRIVTKLTKALEVQAVGSVQREEREVCSVEHLSLARRYKYVLGANVIALACVDKNLNIGHNLNT